MLRFVLFALAFPLTSFADPHKEEDNCPDGKQHHRAVLRHRESGGIGYENGYTTFEVFLASDPSQWALTPFLDARGHVFDNGKWAANGGVGLRALWGNRVYGINGYYDYRNTGRFKSNQIGAGLETLGQLFDFRINGYLPIGTKTSSPYDAVFEAFSGHYMLVSQKMQSAMKGANAEFGFHFGKSDSFDFYAAAGPYYFIGEKAPATWGGKARISGTFKDILTLEISDSYDRTFHNKLQGQIALSFSLGPPSKVKEQGRTCTVASTLNDRMLQPVGREEIIVIDHTRKNSIAIDPATGLPYFFVFVDNTSSSDGTYESPYHTLAQAQSNSSSNDIIYVFPGDGTTKGMDSGITLKANQKFWGSGVSHSIQTSQGTISIPAQSGASPTITNTDVDTEGNAINLATNNAISGFIINSATNNAIYGADPQSLDVSSCTFKNTTTFTIDASFSGSATLSVTNNQFLNNGNGISLTLNGDSTFVCSGNTFEGQTSVSEPPLQAVATGNSLVAQIKNNVFSDNIGGGILFTLGDIVDADISVLGNTFANNGVGASNPSFSSSLALRISAGETVDYCSVTFEGNTSSQNQSNSMYLHTDGVFTTLEAVFSDNTISDNHIAGATFLTPVDTFTLLATGNTITGCVDNGIAIVAGGSTSTGQITINNNTITNIGNMSSSSSAIVINQDFAALTLTILDNEISNCEGSGIDSYPPTQIDSFTMTISGNTISHCQNNGGNAASGISFDKYLDLTSTVTNNTLSGNVNPGVAFGSYSSGDPTVCLTLSGNSSDTDYSLTNPGSGAFNLSPCNASAVNTGTIDSSGTITPVQSCPAATPCPH